MALKFKTTGAAEYGRWIRALVCGDPGAGKTLIASTFPNPVVASAEGGLMSLASRGVPFVEITASDQLNQLNAIFSQPRDVRNKMISDAMGREIEADTLVVDTIDEVQRILVRERLIATKQDQMKVQDWGWLGDQMRLIVRTLRNLDCHVVFTCHLKKVENQETGSLSFYPQIQGAFGEEIPGNVDLAVVLRARPASEIVDGEAVRVMKRAMQTFPDNTYPWLKDRSGKLPALFDVNLQDDFQRINEMIFGDLDGSTVPAPAQSSAGAEGAPPSAAPAPETVVSVAPATVEVEAGVGPGPEEDAASVGRFTCEVCSASFDDEDVRDLSVIKHSGKVLCRACQVAA